MMSAKFFFQTILLLSLSQSETVFADEKLMPLPIQVLRCQTNDDFLQRSNVESLSLAKEDESSSVGPQTTQHRKLLKSGLTITFDEKSRTEPDGLLPQIEISCANCRRSHPIDLFKLRQQKTSFQIEGRECWVELAHRETYLLESIVRKIGQIEEINRPAGRGDRHELQTPLAAGRNDSSSLIAIYRHLLPDSIVGTSVEPAPSSTPLTTPARGTQE